MDTFTARRGGGLLTLAVAALLGTGCASGGGQLGDILGGVLGGGAQEGQLVAEVQTVDTDAREIDFRTEDGRFGSVAYDASTRVVYQGREYQPTALERGDLAVFHVRELSDGRLYTERVEVRESVQDRSGTGTPNTSQISGTVAWVDSDAGRFGLRRSDGRTITVSLPWDATRQTVDRFRALRQGDTVRIEGDWLNDDRVEVRRFI